MSLGLCDGCKRHARTGQACPFCGVEIDSVGSPLPRRMARAALIVLAASGQPFSCASAYGGPPPTAIVTPAVDASLDDGK